MDQFETFSITTNSNDFDEVKEVAAPQSHVDTSEPVVLDVPELVVPVEFANIEVLNDNLDIPEAQFLPHHVSNERVFSFQQKDTSIPPDLKTVITQLSEDIKRLSNKFPAKDKKQPPSAPGDPDLADVILASLANGKNIEAQLEQFMNVFQNESKEQKNAESAKPVHPSDYMSKRSMAKALESSTKMYNSDIQKEILKAVGDDYLDGRDARVVPIDSVDRITKTQYHDPYPLVATNDGKHITYHDLLKVWVKNSDEPYTATIHGDKLRRRDDDYNLTTLYDARTKWNWVYKLGAGFFEIN